MSINFKFPVDDAVANHKAEMESSIKTARQHFKDMKAKTQRGARVLSKLATVLPAEINYEVRNRYSYSVPVITLDRQHLAKLRKAVGHLKSDGKSLADADKRTINVYLTADKYPGVRFMYVRELPPAEACICETVEVTQPAYTYKTLVCRPVGEPKPAAVTQEVQS